MNANPYHIKKGSHQTAADGVCVMEFAALLAGEPHTDQPRCVSVALQRFLIPFNDHLGDEDRQRLAPYAARAIGTRDDGFDPQRREMCSRWFLGKPEEWLDLVGYQDQAERLRELRGPRGSTGVFASRVRMAYEVASAHLRPPLSELLSIRAPADAAMAATCAAGAVYGISGVGIYGRGIAVCAAEYLAAYDPAALASITERHLAAGFDLIERMLPKVAIDLPLTEPVAEYGAAT